MIKKILTKSDRVYFFCLFIFLFSTITVFSIQSFQIGKSITLLLFIVLVLEKRKLPLSENRKNEVVLFLLFFASQLISIINAVNIEAFLYRAKDVLFFTIFYLLSLNFLNGKREKNHYSKLLLISSVINSIFVIYLFINSQNIEIIERFLHPQYIERIISHLQNSKIFWESYQEITLPIILHLALPTFLTSLYFVIIILSSLMTNFRTKTLMVFISLISALFFLNKDLKKRGLALFGCISLFVIFGYIMSSSLFSQNYQTVFDRFSLSEKADYTSLLFRKKQWINAFDLFSSYPLTGVGMGNYQEYFSNQRSAIVTGRYGIERTNIIAALDPHNSFMITLAETGLLGFICKLLLIGFFIKKDFDLLRKRGDNGKQYIIAFWTLFCYSMFNPTDNITYNILFLSLRAII